MVTAPASTTPVAVALQPRRVPVVERVTQRVLRTDRGEPGCTLVRCSGVPDTVVVATEVVVLEHGDRLRRAVNEVTELLGTGVGKHAVDPGEVVLQPLVADPRCAGTTPLEPVSTDGIAGVEVGHIATVLPAAPDVTEVAVVVRTSSIGNVRPAGVLAPHVAVGGHTVGGAEKALDHGLSHFRVHARVGRLLELDLVVECRLFQVGQGHHDPGERVVVSLNREHALHAVDRLGRVDLRCTIVLVALLVWSVPHGVH